MNTGYKTISPSDKVASYDLENRNYSFTRQVAIFYHKTHRFIQITDIITSITEVRKTKEQLRMKPSIFVGKRALL